MMLSLAGRIRRKLSRFRTQITSWPSTTETQAIRRLRDNPRSLVLWLDLIGLSAAGRPEASRDQIRSHDLTRTGVILGFKDELENRMAADLESAYKRPEGESAASVCADVMADMNRLRTIAQGRDAHAEGNDSRDAEPYMQMQWDGVIWTNIQNFDFQRVLELAPGHRRHTEFLRQLETSITLVDVSSNGIEACRARFGDRVGGCQLRYFVTTGDSLAMNDSESQTLVNSFDSMVHFDSSVVKAYLHEIARVLGPVGSAFLHHSNYGTVAPSSDWAHDPCHRSDMTDERMRAFASEAGREVTFQRFSGLAEGWGLVDLDAFSVPRRPVGR